MNPFVVTAEGGRWENLDREEVLRALALLFAAGASHELRALPSGRSRLVAADRPGEALDAAAALCEGARGTYYTLNPVRADLGDRAARNADVLSRRWVMVDVDPVKADADSSSTDAEKAEAWKAASAVVDGRIAAGWPEPVVIDSGNGYHLLFLVALANDDAGRKLVGGALRALAKAHDTEGARIDVKVHNAARIAKLPGTWARKGPDAPDRPHRLCRIVWAPDVPLPVSASQLGELAGVAAEDLPEPPPGPSPFLVRASDDGRRSAYVRSAVLQELARVAMAPEGTRNSTLNDAAFRLGTLLGTGEVGRAELEAQLALAARRAGLGEHECRATIRSGLDAGAEQPRGLPAAESARPRTGLTPPRPVGPDGLPEDDEVTTVRLSSVRPVPVEWLWPDRIPLGKITLLAGLAKQGKSFFTMDLAARLSAGELIPCGGGECFRQGSVVLLSAEDDLNDTVRPRLDAAGADVDRIHALTTVRQPDGTPGPFNLSYVPHLERVVLRTGASLVIIDPVTHYVGGKVDDHKVTQLRAVLDPLKDLAARRKVAVLVVSHLNKGSGTNALHRVIGSSAYTALARANWMIVRDTQDPKRRLFLDAGTNIAEDPCGLAYRIVNGRLEWEETPVHMTASEALAAEAEAKPKKEAAGGGGGGGARRAEQAAAWLTALFDACPEIPSNEILDKGEAQGHSRDALFEAKKALGIRAVKQRGAWHWRRDPPAAAGPGHHDAPF